MVSSDWLVMMSPNNQPFAGKQIYLAERTGGRRSRQEEKGREQSKMNGRLFVTKVAAEVKTRTQVTIYVIAYSLHIIVDIVFRKTFKASTSEMTFPRLHS